MKLYKLVTFILFITVFPFYGQTETQGILSIDNTFIYPKGIYNTFEDFKNKMPNTFDELTVKIGNDTIAHRFYYAKNGEKLNKVFAVSDGENLYVDIKSMVKMFNKDDKSQLKDDGKYFLKSKNCGHYIYFEDYFTSKSAAMLGGLVGASAARRIKGIIYDYKTLEFNLFKNITDFRSFIAINHPEYLDGIPTEVSKDEEISIVRRIITEINTKDLSDK